MVVVINTYLIILVYGSLLLLSFLLISNPLQVNKKANFWFGTFFFLWSTFWLEEIMVLIGIEIKSNDFFLEFLKMFQFCTPIVFYSSIVFYTNPDYKLKLFDLKYLIAPIIYIILLFLQGFNSQKIDIQIFVNVLMIGQALFFTILSYHKIETHKTKIQWFYSSTTDIDLDWIEYIIFALLFLTLFIGGYNIFYPDTDLNILANGIILFMVFFTAYNIIKQKEIHLLNAEEREKIILTTNNSTKILPNKELEKIKTELLKLMETEELYLDRELSLKKVADILNLTPHKLSYSINKGFNENFFQFVNKYRVEKAKELLTDKNNEHLSVLGIAFESGFNSKTVFNTTFKKMTSQTPTQYIDSVKPFK